MWGFGDRHRHPRSPSARNISTQRKDSTEDASKVEFKEFNSIINETRFSQQRKMITDAFPSTSKFHISQPLHREKEPRLRASGHNDINMANITVSNMSSHKLSEIDWKIVREGVEQVNNNEKLKELSEEETGHLVKNFSKLKNNEKKRLLNHMRQMEKKDPDKVKRLKILMHGEKIFDDYKKTKLLFPREGRDKTILIKNKKNERKEVSDEVLIVESGENQVEQEAFDSANIMKDAYDDLAEEEVIFMINNFTNMDPLEKPHLVKYLRKLKETDFPKYGRLNRQRLTEKYGQRLAEKHGQRQDEKHGEVISNKKEETEFITLD